MNIKMEKLFKVHDYDYYKNILEVDVKLTIQSLEESETYLSDVSGTMNLILKQKETVIFVIESKEIPVPQYVIDAVIVSNAENLAAQFGKESDVVISPFNSVCTINDFFLDEEAMKAVIEMIVEVIEAYWDSVKGGSYES